MRWLALVALACTAVAVVMPRRTDACCEYRWGGPVAPDLERQTPRNILAELGAGAKTIEVRRISSPVTGRRRVTSSDLLDLGGTYEVWLDGDKIWSELTIDSEVDDEPPSFDGATSAHYGVHDNHPSRYPSRELIIEHPPLPTDTSSIEITVRRPGVSEAWSTSVTPRDLRRTVAARLMCGLFEDLPVFEAGESLCVTLTARDAVGNESGGDVEVCTQAVGCPPLAGLFFRSCELLDPGWQPGTILLDDTPRLREPSPLRWRPAAGAAAAAAGLVVGLLLSRRRRRTWVS